ncbi:N-6 DNA methylase [Sulfitobacter sp. 1A13353]|uniref:type I restriction-modification system subunit M n=1 Tax=Sulfitobacter sp. 1A13353 TaxID=3368568 RepID=UPI0037459691
MTETAVKTYNTFIWSIADLLRGDFKPSEYGRIILPLVILRRLDCVLAKTKDQVVAMANDLPEEIDDESRMMILSTTADAGGQIYNTSRFTFDSLHQQEASELRENLIDYISGFSPNIRDIFIDKFNFTEILKKLDDTKSLWQVFDRFCQIDMHPVTISNLEMGYLFEELIRKFSEMANETAGEHFTPREVVQLLVDLLIGADDQALTGKGVIRRVYDPACGTGGMLSIAEETMLALNPGLKVDLFGQELNGESYATCTSDMMIKGHDASNIAFGNTLTDDHHEGETFHYMLSNPPYGVDWKKFKSKITDEADRLGMDGRFGAGLPRVSDGQFLFVQHMVSKMRDDEKGTRIGIVMNGSPLFTGGAGSGESELRRWLMEQDLVEAIISLPTDIFYNTGIQTYIWILSNRKTEDRVNKVQLIDASGPRFWSAMRKSLGSKRREITAEARAEIVRIYSGALNREEGYGDVSKIMNREAFGYREIRVERPLRLRFEVTEEGLDKFKETKFFHAMSELEKSDAVDLIRSHLGGKVFMSRASFISALENHYEKLQGFGEKHPEEVVPTGNMEDDFFGGIQNVARVLTSLQNFLGGKNKGTFIKDAVKVFGETCPEAAICHNARGATEPDPKLRDSELVPLNEDWTTYFKREVRPFVSDAWVDESYVDQIDGEVGRVGYEINFNRYFYQYVPPRPLAEIDSEMKELEAEIACLLKEVTA